MVIAQCLVILGFAAIVVGSAAVSMEYYMDNGTISEGAMYVVKWRFESSSSVSVSNAIGTLYLSWWRGAPVKDVPQTLYGVLESDLNLTVSQYQWVVGLPHDDRIDVNDLSDWNFSFDIGYTDENSDALSAVGQAFKIQALPSRISASSSGAPIKPTDKPVPGSHQNTNDLSVGALAGVIVGGLTGLGIFVTLAGVAFHYRRKAARRVEPTMESRKGKISANTRFRKPELDARGTERGFYEINGARSIRELDETNAIPRVELHAPSPPTEMDAIEWAELEEGGSRSKKIG
ncbi:hypothetical protein F4808DRAFT_457264 [Astrocystis sublimbata]|nr:hypothetical protein F4808DRAFT_457264 [Astrocystis sublimbata]